MKGASLGERLIVPAVVWLLIAAMSSLFMYGSGGLNSQDEGRFPLFGAIHRRTLLLYRWKDVLARIFGWTGAWIAIAVGFAILSFWRCRAYFREHPNGEALH